MTRKLDFHGIWFRLWITFLGFALLICAILYVVLIMVIQTSYSNERVAEVENARDVISASYGSVGFENAIRSLCVNRRLYVYIISENGSTIMLVDENGVEQKAMPQDDLIIGDIFVILDSTTGYYSYRVAGAEGSADWIVRAQVLARWDGDREVMFVCGSMSPVQETIARLRSRVFIVIGILTIVSALLSKLLADNLTRPISRITDSAQHLAEGRYDSVRTPRTEITEYDLLSETLEMASTEISHMDQLQKELIANVSHDMRTPITNIRAYAELLTTAAGEDAGTRTEYLAIIQEEADHLAKFVAETLDLSRLQTKTMPVNREPSFLATCVLEAYSHFRYRAEHGSQRVMLSVNKELAVLCDRTLIARAVLNLLSNAFRYSDADGCVYMGVSQFEGRALVEIIDNGVGISTQNLPDIWRRYNKFNPAGRHSTGSIGVGLSIAEGIFQLHDAKYGVESIEGAGSRFWFSLALLPETTKE